MEKKPNLKQYLRSEIRKIRPYPPKKKLNYILDYYGLWIAGVLGALFLVIFLIYRSFFTIKDYWFYAVFANTFSEAGNHSGLWQDFAEYTGYDTSEKQIYFNASSYFDPSKTSGTNNSYFQSFVAVTEAGDLDIVTMQKEALVSLGKSGRLMDLSLDELSDFIRQYEDRWVYCEPYDETYSTEPVPIGIDLSDSLLVTKYHLYEGDCVLGISAYTRHPESIAEFLEFALGK